MTDLLSPPTCRLSWADTAASTFGRLWGKRTPPLPRTLFGLPLAPRKSTAGFLAATITGGLIAIGFFGWIAPFRSSGLLSWTWEGGVQDPAMHGWALEKLGLSQGIHSGGWLGLIGIGLATGIISGVAEALGEFPIRPFSKDRNSILTFIVTDLGTWDDNLTLPVITGICIWGLFKILAAFQS
jgi:diacylglycerol kinase (CTP)